MSRSRALVLGGTGAVGSEVLRAVRAAGVPATFTYHLQAARAGALADELAATPRALDLRDPVAIAALVAALEADGQAPDVLIHCAGVNRAAPLAELTLQDWDDAIAINARSAFLAARALAPGMARAGGGDIVLVGALDRAQSLPLPVHFAASQGLLSALTMALARELGPSNTRVNLVALGVLDGGIARELGAELLADYTAFSAMRRVGTAREAARVIAWLALENRYMSGKVVPVNGGI